MQVKQDARQTTDAVEAVQLDSSTGANAANKTIQGVTAGANTLLDRLNTFSGQVLEQGTQKMVDNAKKQAVVDVQNGDLSEFGLTNENSVYGMAYDGAANTAYISQTTAEIKKKAGLLQAENKYSPSAFKTSWDKFSSTTAAGAKKVSPYIEAITTDLSKQYGDAAASAIASSLATAQFALMKKDNEAAVEVFTDEYINAAAHINNNPTAHTDDNPTVDKYKNAAATALVHRNNILASMAKYGQISKVGIEIANSLMDKRLMSTIIDSQFSQAITDDKTTGYILGFRKMAADDKRFAIFSPDEIQEKINKMYKDTASKQNYAEREIKAVETEKTRVREEVLTTFDGAWITGQLTAEQVDLALKNDAITIKDHEDYSKKVWDTGANFTDTGVELEVAQRLGVYNESDIIGITNMTNADKVKYIQKIRTYKSSAEGKWTSTVQGRASLKMLETNYGVSKAGMLAKLTSKRDMIEYGEAYENFIFQMEKLNPAERENKAMVYARASITSQRASHLVAKKDDDASAQKDKAEKVLAMHKRVIAYQRKVGKVKSVEYLMAVEEFRENFGFTDQIKFQLVKEYR